MLVGRISGGQAAEDVLHPMLDSLGLNSSQRGDTLKSVGCLTRITFMLAQSLFALRSVTKCRNWTGILPHAPVALAPSSRLHL